MRVDRVRSRRGRGVPQDGYGDAWRIRNRHVGDGTWSEWQAAGQDVHSVVADPLFVDAAHGDYRLRPESPALARGFEELPYAEIGLLRTEFRRKLPGGK